MSVLVIVEELEQMEWSLLELSELCNTLLHLIKQQAENRTTQVTKFLIRTPFGKWKMSKVILSNQEESFGLNPRGLNAVDQVIEVEERRYGFRKNRAA